MTSFPNLRSIQMNVGPLFQRESVCSCDSRHRFRYADLLPCSGASRRARSKSLEAASEADATFQSVRRETVLSTVPKGKEREEPEERGQGGG
jgi:hypothetical protein